MTHDEYIFDDTSAEPELYRLRLLESVFDPKTREWLLSAGPLVGRRCLEVGAGAGSIAAWLGDQVGQSGRVTAVDSSVRFLAALGPRIDVVEGDMRSADVPFEHFDLVHARYVLIHNAEAGAVLSAMLKALKPGGFLVLEEPDFSAAVALVGRAELKRAVDNVRLATRATFSGRGMDYSFGRALPELVRSASACVVNIDYDCPAAAGKSTLAEMMRLSTLALEDKYVQTGCATASDIAAYAEFAKSTDCWGVYYATVRVLAQKMRA